jgi:predicted thioredoxin/glutaredoxin
LPLPEKKVEKALIVTDTCPICREVKVFLEKKGLTGKVKLIDAGTPEGRQFALEHGVRGVPDCVLIEDGKKVRICTQEEFKKLLEEGV